MANAGQHLVSDDDATVALAREIDRACEVLPAGDLAAVLRFTLGRSISHETVARFRAGVRHAMTARRLRLAAQEAEHGREPES